MTNEKFERRMMRLKGIKLPSQPLIEDDEQTTGRPATRTPNRHYGRIMAEIEEDYEPDNALDDIIVGVVRSFETEDSHKGHKLNAAVIRNMINRLPNISTQAIRNNFGYSKAQSERYAKACRIVLLHKQRHDFRQLATHAGDEQ